MVSFPTKATLNINYIDGDVKADRWKLTYMLSFWESSLILYTHKKRSVDHVVAWPHDQDVNSTQTASLFRTNRPANGFDTIDISSTSLYLELLKTSGYKDSLPQPRFHGNFIDPYVYQTSVYSSKQRNSCYFQTMRTINEDHMEYRPPKMDNIQLRLNLDWNSQTYKETRAYQYKY